MRSLRCLHTNFLFLLDLQEFNCHVRSVAKKAELGWPYVLSCKEVRQRFQGLQVISGLCFVRISHIT